MLVRSNFIYVINVENKRGETQINGALISKMKIV